ncbi:MAG TPA: LON peptidase substrate-binding domain-containing protein, partial [Acidimicrobiales bacterium]
DGRWALVAVGERRIVVERWLPDDPYPRADVRDLPDPPPSIAEVALLPDVLAKLRTALARSAELGEATTPPTVEVATDPVLASHQASALAPIATIDQHALLAAGTVGLRLASLDTLLDDAIDLLDLRRQAGGAGP